MKTINPYITSIAKKYYISSTSEHSRIIVNYMHTLAESFGPWLPGSLMMIFGLVASACSLYGVYRFSRN